jgi:hypothetical protein
MFSKKVEEFDEVKQALLVKDTDLNTIALQIANLQDFKDKYSREYQLREELNQKFYKLNEMYE